MSDRQLVDLIPIRDYEGTEALMCGYGWLGITFETSANASTAKRIPIRYYTRELVQHMSLHNTIPIRWKTDRHCRLGPEHVFLEY